MDQGAALAVKVQGNRRADDGALVRQWALQGLGIALKARLDVQADLCAGRLVELLPAYTPTHYPLHAIVPAREHMPLRVRRLLDALVQGFAGVEEEAQAAPGPAATVPRPAR